MFDMPFDVTSVAQPSMAWFSVAEFKPPELRSVEAWAVEVPHTRLVSRQVADLLVADALQPGAATRIHAQETTIPFARDAVGVQSLQAPSPAIEDVASQRLRLLREEREGKRTTENLTRLRMLNERMASMMPLVRPEQIELLEQLAARAEFSSSKLATIRARLAAASAT